MKDNRTNLIGLSFLLCIIAFFIRDSFLSFSMNYVLGENISFDNSWKLPYQFFYCTLFIISFGIVPFLYLFVKINCNINTAIRKLLSIILIIISGLILLMGRLVYLKFEASRIKDMLQRAEFTSEDEIPRIRFEEINLEIFLIIGLVIGTLITLLLFGKRKRMNACK